MRIYYLSSNFKILKCNDSILLLQFPIFKDILLLNCCENCQYLIAKNKYKINSISKIILTDMHVKNLSGLLGLLSSLNLVGRIKSLHIYGSEDLLYYLELNKKYSHTNFSYIIYIHILYSGLVISNFNYKIYSLYCNNQYSFLIIEQEKSGTFLADKAIQYGFIPNSLYSKLKKGLIFILPDGYLLNGNNFTCINSLGSKIFFASDKYYRRNNLEVFSKSKTIFF